jgi:membrane protein YqaA with SNARE-associated domain
VNNNVNLSWWKLLLMALIPLAIIMSLFLVGVNHIGGEAYAQLVKLISENYFGLGSIFLFVYLVDTFIVPLTADLIFPLVVGMDWYIIIPLIGFASFLGGVSGYLLGWLCSKIPLVRRLTAKAQAKWGPYLDKYGIVIIILSTLTPVPFSTVSWAAGVIKYPKRKAFPAFLFRFVRMGLYFFLFKAGLSTVLL